MKSLDEYIKADRLLLVGKEQRSHYILSLGLLGFSALLLAVHGLSYFGDNPNPVRREEWYIIAVLSTISALVYLFQKSRLQFRKVPTNLSREELEEVIKQVAKDLAWIPTTNTQNIYQARTDPSFFSGSWGERITIVFKFKEVWINNICDPAKQSSMTAMGRNRKNVKVFIQALKAQDID